MKKLLSLLLFLASPAMADQLYDSSIAVPMTVTAGAYIASKSLGGLYTVPVFRSGLSGARLQWASVRSSSGVTPAVTIYVFSANPTASTCTDTSAFALNAADVAKLVYTSSVTLAAPQGSTPTAGTTAMNLGLSFNNTDTIQTNKAYVCIVVGVGGVTPASTTDFSFSLGVSPD
jgi:hypothetical protein